MRHPCTPPFPRCKPSLGRQEQICTSNQSVCDWSPFAEGRRGAIDDQNASQQNRREIQKSGPPIWNCKYDSLLKRSKKPEENMENIHSINKKIDSLLGVLQEASPPLRQYYFAEDKVYYKRDGQLSVFSQENPKDSSQGKIETHHNPYGTPLKQNNRRTNQQTNRRTNRQTNQQNNRQTKLQESLNYSGLSSIKDERQSGHGMPALRQFTLGCGRNVIEKVQERVKTHGLEGSKSVIINGKNIDDQISKIQGRINQMQRIKKQMNLNASMPFNLAKPVQNDVPLPKPFREFYQKRRKNQLRGRVPRWAHQKQTACHRQDEAWGLEHLLIQLRTQISLDERFRQLKQWFHQLRTLDKWKDLDEILKQQQIYIDEQCTRMIFGITQEETNPFSIEMDGFSLLELVEAFLQCESNWSNKIANKHSAQLLESDGLTEKMLDLGCRGYVTFQDFVGFFNIEMEAHYRQRELYLVYDRIKKGEYLHFEDILLTLSV